MRKIKIEVSNKEIIMNMYERMEQKDKNIITDTMLNILNGYTKNKKYAISNKELKDIEGFNIKYNVLECEYTFYN